MTNNNANSATIQKSSSEITIKGSDAAPSKFQGKLCFSRQAQVVRNSE